VDSIIISNQKDLNIVVEKLLAFANGKRKFLLVAEMGTGKTTFVKIFCEHFRVKEETASPTFSLVNEYTFSEGLIRHLDLYRLKNLAEALDIGIEDFFYDDCYLFIEWPEILESILPKGIILIKVELEENNNRVFSFSEI
jgi:tRNA threonylcarbamoyladenosine biosynthesis protein TsaE